MKSLQQFKIDEEIRASYLRNLGDIAAVLKEVSYPAEYVYRVTSKFKKEKKKDSNPVAEGILDLVSQGYKARQLHLVAMLRSLSMDEQIRVSLCCGAPIRRIIESPREDYECLKCMKLCESKLVSKVDVYTLKKEVIEQLREEDKLIIDFAKKMGFTVEKAPDTVIHNKQNVLVVQTTGKDKDVVAEIEKLPPMERDRLIENLSRMIVDVEPEEATQPQ